MGLSVIVGTVGPDTGVEVGRGVATGVATGFGVAVGTGVGGGVGAGVGTGVGGGVGAGVAVGAGVGVEVGLTVIVSVGPFQLVPVQLSLVCAWLVQLKEPAAVGRAMMVNLTHSPWSRAPLLLSASTTTLFPDATASQSSPAFELGLPDVLMTETFVKLAGRSTSRQPSWFELSLLVAVREKVVS